MTEQIWCLTGKLPLATIQKLESIVDTLAEEQASSPPTISYFEVPKSTLWRTEIYFPSAPDYGFINNMLQRADLLDWDHEIAPLEEKDWVSESQKLLAPVRAGCFLVYGSHDKDKANPSCINLQVDAGLAFGTGKHETTAACLEVLTDFSTNISPHTVLDLGTGSGVLALAAHKLWPNARITASDIDPVAVKVTGENVAINSGTPRSPGTMTGGIASVVADGLAEDDLRRDAPYEMIIANILAGPLVDMAKDISDALAQDGRLVLSGLLTSQEKEVLDAYQARGLVSQGRIEKGDWLALTLSKPT